MFMDDIGLVLDLSRTWGVTNVFIISGTDQTCGRGLRPRPSKPCRKKKNSRLSWNLNSTRSIWCLRQGDLGDSALRDGFENPIYEQTSGNGELSRVRLPNMTL